ncbi:hypothetical protein [Pseudomonas syringae]|uniref:hypothetical protein n=1 Tax=Pseudomonas syringae TaxID=317 RepID=UPI001111B603|nr:hypothetical protein [Pseudomonas syringae]
MSPHGEGVSKLTIYTVLLSALFPILGNAKELVASPEPGKKALIYNELQRQFIQNTDKTEMPKLDCSDNSFAQTGYNLGKVEILSPSGKYREVDSKSQCLIDISTGCQLGMFPVTEIETEGQWAWTKSRIGHLYFLHEIARKYGVPNSILEKQFNAMNGAILKNIQRRINMPIKIKKNGLETGLGTSNDIDNDKTSAKLERAFAGSWNLYVHSLPTSQQVKFPILVGVEEGCGAGETSYDVEIIPPGGKLRMISDIDAQLCEALHVDPWDMKCQGWSVIGSKDIGLVGTYRYSIEWSNGNVVRDKLTVNQQREKKLCLPQRCP